MLNDDGWQTRGSEYVAHISEDGARCESVATHLHQVAERAAEFAVPFQEENWAYAVGLLHDIGKYSNAFQNRILRGGRRVDHSTAGAAEIFSRCPSLAYCIAGHHGGLPDGGTEASLDSTLMGRMNRAKRGDLPEYGAWCSEISMPPLMQPIFNTPPRNNEDMRFSLSFLIRMVFSCLVDADYLCTERFMRGEDRDGLQYEAIETLRDRLEGMLIDFYPPATLLNEIRCGLLDECRAKADFSPGVFSLTAPTGAGKTYALMRFALQHACSIGNGMRRVIVAEPYTSIIEQNADVYRSVFGLENVLEHHANFDFEGEAGLDDVGNRLRLASENWDAPIIVTTNVQLFESLFASKTSRCRKLHNTVGSVIVLDEAQMIPTEFFLPCIKALAELVRNYGCSVVLSSATQPAPNRFFEDEGFSVTEIVSDVPALFGALNRVTYQVDGRLSDEELAENLSGESSVLCIVNSRRQARHLFELLEEMGREDVFHLTTLMYPAHRKRVLACINQRLQDGERCVVVSTSLVEAGVDLDFPVVYRALAGVDSMVQAAGRCNREGRRSASESIVHLFESSEAYSIPAEIRQRVEVARSAIPDLAHPNATPRLGSPELVSSFFNRLYFYKGEQELDAHNVLRSFETYPLNVKNGFPSIEFRSAAERFRLIREGALSIVVPFVEIDDVIARIRAGEVYRGDVRRLSPYTVSVYEHDWKELWGAGAIEKLSEGLFLLLDAGRYKETTGLDVTVAGGEGMYW